MPRDSGASGGDRASPARGDGASAGDREVKERGLSLDNAGTGPFWCNRIITEGRASLSKHTRLLARPLPRINIKDRCIVFCKRSIPSPSMPSLRPRLRRRVSPGSARRSAWSLLFFASSLYLSLLQLPAAAKLPPHGQRVVEPLVSVSSQPAECLFARGVGQGRFPVGVGVPTPVTRPAA